MHKVHTAVLVKLLQQLYSTISNVTQLRQNIIPTAGTDKQKLCSLHCKLREITLHNKDNINNSTNYTFSIKVFLHPIKIYLTISWSFCVMCYTNTNSMVTWHHFFWTISDFLVFSLSFISVSGLVG